MWISVINLALWSMVFALQWWFKMMLETDTHQPSSSQP